jgi:flagellum-specific ATP synthase
MGAYRAGTDPAVDEALALAPRIETLLRQERSEQTDLLAAFQLLREVLRPGESTSV